MASIDINPTATRPQRGFSAKRRKAALRIDMTPMVDLGFLLITFFIFTATMNEPKAMDLFMPKDDGPPTPASESGALSIIADKDGSVFYYEGKPSVDGGNFKKSSLADIREKIIDKKQEVVSKYKPDAACEAMAVANKTNIDDCRQKNLTILIKPTIHTDYKTIVALLDEMTINRIARYALVDPDEVELAALENAK